MLSLSKHGQPQGPWTPSSSFDGLRMRMNERTMDNPLTQPSPPRGEGLSILALSLRERVG